MVQKSILNKIARRLVICSLIALVFVFAISEIAFRFQRDRVPRDPQTVNLVIPSGTADRIAAGEPVPSIPDEFKFLVGDILTVENQDEIDHQLGPVWVPPGTSASLVLEEVNNFAYACSFKPSRYLGIYVRQATTLATRFTALILAVPPTAMILLVYSLLIYPLEGKKEIAAARAKSRSSPQDVPVTQESGS